MVPLHMAMVAAVANNGVMMKPYVVGLDVGQPRAHADPTRPEEWLRPISPRRRRRSTR